MRLSKLLCGSILSIALFTFSQCKKDKKSALEQLPAETQTGANSFGCLIDGKAFIPAGDPFGGPVKKAQYQYVNGRYAFGISGSKSSGEEVGSISIVGDSVIISTGTFDLTRRAINGKLSGGYYFSKLGTLGNIYGTNETVKGQLIIKKFDQINLIVSGTFWFDAIDTTTKKNLQIREGRFDLRYVL